MKKKLLVFHKNQYNSALQNWSKKKTKKQMIKIEKLLRSLTLQQRKPMLKFHSYFNDSELILCKSVFLSYIISILSCFKLLKGFFSLKKGQQTKISFWPLRTWELWASKIFKIIKNGFTTVSSSSESFDQKKNQNTHSATKSK